MIHSALCEIIDRLIRDSGMSDNEAFCLLGKLFLEELPGCIEMLEASEDGQPAELFRA